MTKRRIGMMLSMCMAMLTAQGARVVTYPAAKGAPMGEDYEVRVRTTDGDWQTVPVYSWKVDHTVEGRHRVEQTNVAQFDFEGEVEVEVRTLKAEVAEARIRPLSYAIGHEVEDGRTVRFRLREPRLLSVEVNGDVYHNLQLFANPICQEAEARSIKKMRKDKKVRYYGPGYYDLGQDSIHLKSGETLYVDGGAYIKGWVSTYGSNDVKVCGRGYINPERQKEGLMVRYSRNVTVDGIMTTQIPVGGSDSVSVSNAKVMTWYGWGDGMNVFASNNVSYRHVFARTSDDCSTIYCTRKGYRGGCRNVSVEDAVYWADVAHPIMIGLHGDIEKEEVIEDVVYRNIDILDQNEGQTDYQGCLAINNGDNITVRRVLFDDIRIERLTRGMMLNFRVCYNRKYCTAPGRGIHDVTLRNIQMDGDGARMSIMAGYNEERTISGIRFENLRINGRHIYDTMPEKPKWYKTADFANMFVGEHVEEVVFE